MDHPQPPPDKTRLICWSYVPAVVFVALFVVCLLLGPRLSGSFGPGWACLIAAMLTLPLLAPAMIAHVLPRIKSIRISQVEIALQEIKTSVNAIAAAARMVSENLADQPVLTEYAGRMTSLVTSIVDAINAVQAGDRLVLPVDLQTPWAAPNLYFLALAAAQKSRVHQLVFIESVAELTRFVCTSSPLEVVAALGRQYPALKEAARTVQVDLDPTSIQAAAGAQFFQHLAQIYGQAPTGNTERVTILTAPTLLWLLGPAAHQEAIQWTEPPSETQYRTIIASPSPFVAALRGADLLFLVSRDRVATAIARAVLASD